MDVADGSGVLLIVTHFLYVTPSLLVDFGKRTTTSKAGTGSQCCFVFKFSSLSYPPRSHDAMAKRTYLLQRLEFVVLKMSNLW